MRFCQASLRSRPRFVSWLNSEELIIVLFIPESCPISSHHQTRLWREISPGNRARDPFPALAGPRPNAIVSPVTHWSDIGHLRTVGCTLMIKRAVPSAPNTQTRIIRTIPVILGRFPRVFPVGQNSGQRGTSLPRIGN